jgi:hypothetical protein
MIVRIASYIISVGLAKTKAIGSFGMGRVLCAAVANLLYKIIISRTEWFQG